MMLFFDLETLGKFDDCVVLSLGCVPFTFDDPEDFLYHLNRGILIKFNVGDQIRNYHRKVDKVVLEWWKKQNKLSFDRNVKPSPFDVALKDGLIKLSDFIKNLRQTVGTSWSRGIGFDFSKLESLYNCCNLKLPYDPFKVRDVRTFFDILQRKIRWKI